MVISGIGHVYASSHFNTGWQCVVAHVTDPTSEREREPEANDLLH